DRKWMTMFKYKKTTKSDAWESGKEYQVALMLQGNKSSVYIDGKSLGEEETMVTGETPLELAGFCFGACGMKNSPVTVKNVFLYNRPLSVGELKMVKKSDGKKGNGDGKKGSGDGKKGSGDGKKGSGDGKKGKGDGKKGKGDGSMRGGVSRLLLLGFCAFVVLY
ncbi:trans-sialidase, partial [Trypanosoma cruzi]